MSFKALSSTNSASSSSSRYAEPQKEKPAPRIVKGADSDNWRRSTATPMSNPVSGPVSDPVSVPTATISNSWRQEADDDDWTPVSKKSSQIGRQPKTFVQKETNQECRYGSRCTNSRCTFEHSQSRSSSSSSVPKRPLCKFDPRCTNARCTFEHPSRSNATGYESNVAIRVFPATATATACRYGKGCTKESCTFSHNAPCTAEVAHDIAIETYRGIITKTPVPDLIKKIDAVTLSTYIDQICDQYSLQMNSVKAILVEGFIKNSKTAAQLENGFALITEIYQLSDTTLPQDAFKGRLFDPIDTANWNDKISDSDYERIVRFFFGKGYSFAANNSKKETRLTSLNEFCTFKKFDTDAREFALLSNLTEDHRTKILRSFANKISMSTKPDTISGILFCYIADSNATIELIVKDLFIKKSTNNANLSFKSNLAEDQALRRALEEAQDAAKKSKNMKNSCITELREFETTTAGDAVCRNNLKVLSMITNMINGTQPVTGIYAKYSQQVLSKRPNLPSPLFLLEKVAADFFEKLQSDYPNEDSEAFAEICGELTKYCRDDLFVDALANTSTVFSRMTKEKGNAIVKMIVQCSKHERLLPQITSYLQRSCLAIESLQTDYLRQEVIIKKINDLLPPDCRVYPRTSSPPQLSSSSSGKTNETSEKTTETTSSETDSFELTFLKDLRFTLDFVDITDEETFDEAVDDLQALDADQQQFVINHLREDLQTLTDLEKKKVEKFLSKLA